MKNLKSYNDEEAFIIALKDCKDSKEIFNALNGIILEDIGKGRMDMYDEFITKNSDLRYCGGCQLYHDKKETIFEHGQCADSLQDIINLNNSLIRQGEKHREDMEEYYHR